MKTGRRLWNKIRHLNKAVFMTDNWRAYGKFIPVGVHIQSKAETYTVEGYNCLLRHFLARLKRKTKCYSKSVYMLYLSINLFFHKWNNTLSI